MNNTELTNALAPCIFERQDYSLHYWLGGPEGAPLIVFIHGSSMDHRMFLPQMKAVLGHFRVLLWDLPGHGKSRLRKKRWVFFLKEAVEDLKALLDELNCPKAVLIGHSLGASISQEFIFLYPERVSGLVVLGGTCLTTKLSFQDAIKVRIRGLLIGLLPHSAQKKAIGELAGVTPEVQHYTREAFSQVPKEVNKTLAKALPGFFHDEPGYTIPCPFLLIHGEKDAVKRVRQQAPVWSKREPTCEYAVIPGAGHNANQDNPEFFNKVLLRFLAKIG